MYDVWLGNDPDLFLQTQSPHRANMLSIKRVHRHLGKRQQEPPQPFYGPFSGTKQVSWYQKGTSAFYRARED